MKVTIYHNPNCGTSRGALALIRERGIEPEIIEYLKTPLDKTGLLALAKKMQVPVRDGEPRPAQRVSRSSGPAKVANAAARREAPTRGRVRASKLPCRETAM